MNFFQRLLSSIRVGTKVRERRRKGGSITYRSTQPLFQFGGPAFPEAPRQPRKPRQSKPKPQAKPTASRPATAAENRRVTRKLNDDLFCVNCGRDHVRSDDHWCPRCMADLTLPGLAPQPVRPKTLPRAKFSPPHTLGAKLEGGVIRVAAHSRAGRHVKGYTRRLGGS